jgi:DNA-binding CsgD family transcriptional regulator
MSGADVALTPAARQIVPLMARCAFERIQDVGHEMVQRCSLTAREREILSWVARGECAAEIGHVLNIAARTVETHIRHACLKLRASNRAHAVAIALSDRHIQV